MEQPQNHSTKLETHQSELAAALQGYLNCLEPEQRLRTLNFASQIIQRRNQTQNELIRKFLDKKTPDQCEERIEYLISDLGFDINDFGIDINKLDVGEDFQRKLECRIHSILRYNQNTLKYNQFKLQNLRKNESLIEIWTQVCGRKVSELDWTKFIGTIQSVKVTVNKIIKTLVANPNDTLDLEIILAVIEFLEKNLDSEIPKLGPQKLKEKFFDLHFKNIGIKKEQSFESIKAAVHIWKKVLKRDLQKLDGDTIKKQIKQLIESEFFERDCPNLKNCKQLIEFWQSEMASTFGDLDLRTDFAEKLKQYIETQFEKEVTKKYAFLIMVNEVTGNHFLYETLKINGIIEEDGIWIWVNYFNQDPLEIDGIVKYTKECIENLKQYDSGIEVNPNNATERYIGNAQPFYRKRQAINVWTQILGEKLSDLNLENLRKTLDFEIFGPRQTFQAIHAEMWLNFVYDPNREGDNETREDIILKLKSELFRNLFLGCTSNDAKKYFKVWQEFEPEKAAAVSAFLQLTPEQQKSILESAETDQQSEVAAGNIDSQIDHIRDLTAQVISERQKPN